MLYQLNPEDRRLLVEEIKINIIHIKKKNIQKKWSNIVAEHLHILKSTSYQAQNLQTQQVFPKFNNNFNNSHNNSIYPKNQARIIDPNSSYVSKLNDSTSTNSFNGSYGANSYPHQYTSTQYESRYGEVPMKRSYQPFYPSNYSYPKTWSHKEGAI